MVEHVTRCLPEEACGLLGGREDLVEVVIPVTNVLHAANRFRMDPREQIEAMFWLKEQQLDCWPYITRIRRGHGNPRRGFTGACISASCPHDMVLIDGTWQANCYCMQNGHYKTVRLERTNLA
jgi:hypothetical protein